MCLTVVVRTAIDFGPVDVCKRSASSSRNLSQNAFDDLTNWVVLSGVPHGPRLAVHLRRRRTRQFVIDHKVKSANVAERYHRGEQQLHRTKADFMQRLSRASEPPRQRLDSPLLAAECAHPNRGCRECRAIDRSLGTSDWGQSTSETSRASSSRFSVVRYEFAGKVLTKFIPNPSSSNTTTWSGCSITSSNSDPADCVASSNVFSSITPSVLPRANPTRRDLAHRVWEPRHQILGRARRSDRICY